MAALSESQKQRRSNKSELKFLTQSWGPASEASLGRSGSGELRQSKDSLKTSKDQVDLRIARRDVPAIISPAPPSRTGSGMLTQSTGSFSMIHRITGLSNINDYEKMKQIGEGTYGQVYMAKHKTSGKFVAVKRASWVTREGVPITTIREVKILKMLHHPNVVQLFDIASSNNNVYLIFEYLDADFLRLLRNHIIHHMPEGQVKGLGLQLLQGVAFLHDNRIMHRDIKASNLLVSRDGTLKIADFGLARELSNITGYAQYTNRVVTLWYRSPELLLGTTSYGPAIDMWSYGCLYAEFLILQPLAPGKTEIEEMDLIVRLVGYPTEETMPGWHLLPFARTFLKNDPPPGLRPTLPERLKSVSRLAAALITNLLSLNPAMRMSAKEALEHAYFAADPLPFIAPIDLSDRRDPDRQRREAEREREKEREKERERERLREERAKEKIREELLKKRSDVRSDLRAIPNWPPISEVSASPVAPIAPIARIEPAPAASTLPSVTFQIPTPGARPAFVFSMPPSASASVPAATPLGQGERVAPAATMVPALAPLSWLPNLTPAMLPTAVLSSPSSNEEEDAGTSSSSDSAPAAAAASTSANGVAKTSPARRPPSAAPDPPPPMAITAPSPTLSPLSPQAPVSPSRLREDPTAFHTLGSEPDGASGSESAGGGGFGETAFHFDDASGGDDDLALVRDVAAARERATYTHYYRQYYRRYLDKYSERRHGKRKGKR